MNGGAVQLHRGAIHLRREQYRSMPWRNGGGVTLEIAREPAAGSEFLWRLSLATVAASGPFSMYAGYQRSVTLIGGAGFRLAVDTRDPVVLDSIGASVLFPGDAATDCTLLHGPASDLSLMVRMPGAVRSVTRLQGDAAHGLPLPSDGMVALFCLGGEIMLSQRGTPDSSSAAPATLHLSVHDTVLLCAPIAALSLHSRPGAPVDLLLLTWTAASASSS
jgi:environmental stress-induced protein Ves